MKIVNIFIQFIHGDIKKLLYKYMRCREENCDGSDDCKCGEYYETEPEFTIFIICVREMLF